MKKDGIARAERPFYGMCYRCADKVEEGQKLCARCRATSMRNLDKRTKTPQEMEHYQAWKADNAIIFAKRTI